MVRESCIKRCEKFVADYDSPNSVRSGGDPKSHEYVNHITDIPIEELANTFIIVEPWENIGSRPQDGIGIRGSLNLAWVIKQILGIKSYIIPVYKERIRDIKQFALLSSLSFGTIFEGGRPDVHDSNTFSENFTRKQATDLLAEMMLVESPFLAICLSHQLTAHAHVKLIKQAVERLLRSKNVAFEEVAKKILSVGTTLKVIKDDEVLAEGWDAETFSVSPCPQNVDASIRLYPYKAKFLEHIPPEVTETHQLVAELYHATIDRVIRHGDINVQALHNNEVSEEAAQFICWAYQLIHRLVIAYSSEVVSNEELTPLLSYPIGLEITSSSRKNDAVTPLCNVSSTAIYWKHRLAQTIQFHPEIDVTLRTVVEGWHPSWFEMKKSRDIRLLVQLLRGLLSRDLTRNR